MLVFKILTEDEAAALQRDKTFAGAPVDLEDGYIHLSAGWQVAETAARHFRDAGALELVACDADALGEALKWEESRGGARFPHLYRPLSMADVVWIKPLLRDADGSFRFPEDVGP